MAMKLITCLCLEQIAADELYRSGNSRLSLDRQTFY